MQTSDYSPFVVFTIQAKALLSLALFVLGMQFIKEAAFSQELVDPNWLPATSDEKLARSLRLASSHVLSREGCEALLEAKVSESGAKDNPKFIVTCENALQETVNFVYWQSDVDENFTTISYPEKPVDKKASALNSKADKLKLQLEEHAELITQCKSVLDRKLLGKSIVMGVNPVSVSQRGTLPVVINIDYQIGGGGFAPKFTATCRQDATATTRLAIFPR